MYTNIDTTIHTYIHYSQVRSGQYRESLLQLFNREATQSGGRLQMLRIRHLGTLCSHIH